MGKNMIYYTPFGKEMEEIDLTKLTDDFSGHGGGDVRMVSRSATILWRGRKVPPLQSWQFHWKAIRLHWRQSAQGYKTAAP